ncbi:potassium-transporting ATPase subunit KdpA [Parachlamydia sp. AcF125]|uniref:potassium-transporting ATPase subunit KdpA n=1 Tax=Parachlamydia sp. AcF125 TaxID=2795736 RepID=UPI001BCA2687|nr:potassium-transporting ATPase subunit KdpA [Parachlamydia sp. AcF125]MBS4167666.1 Potassium-transporting ATPase potassium-binding subunit [Parachlamydia sp. AcF125]
MSSLDGIQILVFIALLLLVTPLLGHYIADIFSDKKTVVKRYLGWLEKSCYWAAGVDPQLEMTWKEYAKALGMFNLWGFLFLFFLLLMQGFLPFNPQHFSGISGDLAYNIAISFVTNTNWQSYAGETTLGYLAQMLGLTTQNFLSAATGMATLLVLMRGMTRQGEKTVGNFWRDLVRTIVYLLLPFSILFAIFLVNEGVVQTLSPYVETIGLEGNKQMIPLGPVASQVAIKQLGTNGGGFFNANSAHPYENPSAFTNFLEMFALLIIPAATVYAYGLMISSKKHAWILYALMLTLWMGSLGVSIYAENLANPLLNSLPYLEGKETRFGLANSLLWSVTTTGTSNGSVNAMLSSLSPMAGGSALFNLMLGELIFGGIGVGLCALLMYTLLTIFLSGLMVGRTPAYLGKKIEAREVKWVMLSVLTPSALILLGSGITSILPTALSSISNQGPHGLSEILYAFSSAAGNNGSAFAGLNANTPYYNLMLGTVMLICRGSTLLPSLAIGGLLAEKKAIPPSMGTFSVESLLFAILLGGIILIIGGLTFFPALTLGPLAEHLLMLQKMSF